MYTTDVNKMYTKCITHFDKLVYILYTKLKEAKLCIKNVYKSLLKCRMHFVYILHTPILINEKCTS